MSLIPTTPANSAQDYRRRAAYLLMQQGTDASPVQHWAQGLARLGQGALGGYEMYQADQKDKTDEREAAQAYISMLQGGSPGSTAGAPVSPAAAPVAAPAQAAPTPAQPAAPAVASGVAPPVTGPRPGGPVMPTGKVWGDAEAEAAGLYEPTPKNVKLASALAQPEIPMQAPMPTPAPQVTEALAKPQVAQAALPASDPRKAQVIKLLQGSPAEQRMGRALADQVIGEQFKPETTDEIKEYNLYRKQGGNLNFYDYKSGIKKAGAQNITIDQKPQLAFDTEAGKLQAKRFDDLAADGQTAKQMVSDIQTLTDLGKNIGTGKTAEFKASIGPYAEALGLKVEGLSDIQAYEAVVNRLAPNLRVKGSGAQSDMELKNFLKSLPTLGNTPEGNEISSKVLTGLQENKILAAEIGSKALTGEITRSEAEKQLRNLPDPMGPYREYMKANRGAPTATGTRAAAPPTGIDPAALDEARRRGLIK